MMLADEAKDFILEKVRLPGPPMLTVLYNWARTYGFGIENFREAWPFLPAGEYVHNVYFDFRVEEEEDKVKVYTDSLAALLFSRFDALEVNVRSWPGQRYARSFVVFVTVRLPPGQACFP